MPTVELTREQLLEAARQLPYEDRLRLIKDLLQRPTVEEVDEAAKRLRPKYRLPPHRRGRLSELLSQVDAGSLTPDGRRELDSLLDDVDRRNLEMARELVGSFGIVPSE